jgi:hypothetical protein
MKKILFISFVASTLIFINLEGNSSARFNLINDGTQSLIRYQAIVHPDANILANSCAMYIQMANPDGTIVGQPLLYVHGVNTYYFFEPGPVTGTRVVIMSNIQTGGKENVCMNISVKGTRTGTFYNSVTYTIDLYDFEHATIENSPASQD